MMGYRLSVFRHGKTEANEKGIYIGRTDYPLSESGKNELIEKTEEFIYPKVQRVYSSPLKRCMETGSIIFPDREIIAVNDLRELDFGDFEGKSVDELINREDYKKWLKGGIDNHVPNGESLQDMTMRVFSALNQIILNMMSEDFTHCAVVTHSGILTNMMTCFGIPKYDAKDLYCDAGEGFEVLVTAQMWQRSQAFEILGKVPYQYASETDID